MSLSRRSFIRIAGTSAVILAAGAGAFLLTRDPTNASKPWRSAADTREDPRHKALAYAILAPNPHNRQPWLVDLSSAGEAVLYCDRDRLLPETDPFSRQIVIGLGCFLEILRIAAAEDGYEISMTPFPDGEPGEALDDRPVAHIAFTRTAGVNKDPLFRHVLNRRSNKEPYDTARTVDPALLTTIVEAAGGKPAAAASAEPALVDALRDLTWRAHLIEVETPRTLMESIRLMRIGKAEIEANPDGIDLGGPMMDSLKVFGLIDREQMADPASTAFKQGLEIYRAITQTAMGYVWIVTDGNSRAAQLDAGRRYVRANLAATAAGLAMHPLSQALQEYPEMSALYRELRETLDVSDGRTAQMLARVGYGPEIGPSPRWPFESRIVRA
ncbi:MAG: nitroreductase family protein [Minwuiales bacterium]|nr:nitroreductase family protein [Minwuiales bacterium]